MGEDETGSLAALKELIAGLIDPTITEYKGRIVKLMGDGVLAEFACLKDHLATHGRDIHLARTHLRAHGEFLK